MKIIIRQLLLGVAVLSVMLPTLALADVTFGNPKGEITLVEYFDYNCPVCRSYAAVINALAKQNRNLRVIQRVIPIVAPTSQVVDRAVLASYLLGRFSELQRQIIHSGYSENIPLHALGQMARNVGINMRQLAVLMQSDTVTNQLKQNLLFYEETHRRVVPVLVFYRTSHPNNKFQVNGAVPYGQLQNLVNTLVSEHHVSQKI